MRTNWVTSPAIFLAEHSKTPTRAVVSIGVAYWARNMVLLYLPPHLVKACVWYSVRTSRYETFGKIWGYAVLAPTYVQPSMPYIGALTFSVTVAATYKSITFICQKVFKEQVQSPTPVK